MPDSKLALKGYPDGMPQIQCRPDRYGGYVCSVEGFEGKQALFRRALEDALSDWIRLGIRGVWFSVPSKCPDLLVPLIDKSFTIHHAKADYIMLARWLPTNEPCMLPEYACTYVGVGGIVLDGRGNMLVVSERYSHDSVVRWKLPGGHVAAGEGLPTAIEREVYEETGIKAQFHSIISMRHNQQYMFGCSDIYICCLLHPTTFDIKWDQSEISDSKWMSIAHFLGNPDVFDVNKHLVAQCLLQGSRGLPLIKRFPGSMVFGSNKYSFDTYRVDVIAKDIELLSSSRAAAGLLRRSPSLDGDELMLEEEMREIQAVGDSAAARWIRNLLSDGQSSSSRDEVKIVRNTDDTSLKSLQPRVYVGMAFAAGLLAGLAVAGYRSWPWRASSPAVYK